MAIYLIDVPIVNFMFGIDIMIKVMFVILFGCCFFSSSAFSQIKAEHPRNCIFNVGPTEMMFSAFQEGKTDAIFCQNIGDIGQTLIILDARQAELSNMNVEALILRNVNQKDWQESLVANTVAVMPADKYLMKKNTLNFSHNFTSGGNYFLVVKASSDDGLKEYVGQYGFYVDDGRQWISFVEVLIGVSAITFVGIFIHNRAKKTS